MPFNFVVQILQIGFVGLAFLLAFMAYRLLGQQSAREHPQLEIVRLISRYMWFALALSLLAVAAQATQIVLSRVKPKSVEIEELHTRIGGNEAMIKQLESSLRESPDPRQQTNVIVEGSRYSCDQGYVSGIEVSEVGVTNSGGNIGRAVSRVSITCRPLNVGN